MTIAAGSPSVQSARACIGDDAEGASLVHRIRGGDPSAEGELIQLFHRRLVAMLTVRTRDADAARELAQETTMAVLAALREGRIRDPGKLAAFVHGVARNLANNHLRVRARDRGRQSELTEEMAAPDPPDALELRERIELLESAIGRLSLVDRRILTLTLVSGWKPGAVGRALGLSASIVRTRKSRAVRRVQEIVAALTRSARQVPPV